MKYGMVCLTHIQSSKESSLISEIKELFFNIFYILAIESVLDE